MQVLEHSPARLVIQSRRKAFQALGTVLLLVPTMGLVLVAHSAFEWLERPELRARELPPALLLAFAGLFVAGLVVLVYGPYRVTYIFDRSNRAYVKESTSVRRTRRVEFPLAAISAVEVEEEEEGGYRVVLVSDAGQKLPLGDPTSTERAQVDAVAELVESFLTPA